MGEKAPSNKCWAYPQSQVVAGLGVGRPGRNVEAQAVATGSCSVREDITAALHSSRGQCWVWLGVWAAEAGS